MWRERQRENVREKRMPLSGIKCHSYCEISLIKNGLVLSMDVLKGVKWTVKYISPASLSTLVSHQILYSLKEENSSLDASNVC